MSFLITTTGTVQTVIFNDLGARTFEHPTTDYDLQSEYSIFEITRSDDVANALTTGAITATYNGGSVTDTDLVKIGTGDMNTADYDTDGDNVVNDSELLNGQSSAYHLNRTNHTGTQLASTISDFDTSADARISNQKDVANGIAGLNANGKLNNIVLPSIAITDVFVVADIAARDALTVQTGDVAKVGDSDGIGNPQTYIYDGTSWIDIQETSDVISVNGQKGTIVLDSDDIQEGATNLYYSDARVRVALGVDPASPLTFDSATGIFSISQASTTTDGYLSSADFNTFNDKVSADGSVDSHSDVDTTGKAEGNILEWNGTSWVAVTNTKRSSTFSFAVDSKNVRDRFLNKTASIPSNLSPFIAFATSKLRYISFSVSTATAAWTVDVRVNGTSVATLAAGSTETSGVSALLDVTINAGDKISLFANTGGNGIKYPSVDILLEEI